MDFNPAAATTHTVYSDNPTRPVNGSVKKNPPSTATQSPTSMAVPSSSYKECLKNHAASIGGHALDGCGEFMPSLSSDATDPRSLKCAACGCHRNFHRRDQQQEQPQFLNCFYSPAIPHRSFSPSASPSSSRSPSRSPMSSPSPPPLSHFPPPPSSFHSPGVAVPHHMLLALGTSYSIPSKERHQSFNSPATAKENRTGKKRCRTKFSSEQKEKLYAFSEKLGWKMQKVDDGLIQEFCNEIGVSRVVFKVWMHNHKNTFRTKRSESENNNNDDNNNAHEKVNEDEDNSNNGGGFDSDIDKNPIVNSVDLHASSVNGSSSS